ncbi:hypothetical protein [Actinosynnema sp. ALI-1.44]|uniref:hypothetical protein n=1 Tax=Actinosynnema sp. ALI-1.44 TaxID=1933779 RepID=UPI001177D1F3|nr:hypothetical protein [Actinosynnema sp. ALI-1.44]
MTGQVKVLPREEHCAVLEAMFPGWTTADLLKPRAPQRDNSPMTVSKRVSINQSASPESASKGNATEYATSLIRNFGLRYAPCLKEAVSTLELFIELDSSRESTSIRDKPSEDASNAAALEWLVGRTDADAYEPEPSGAALRDDEVQEIITTTAAFDQLDRRVGGGFSRNLAVEYLQDRVIPRAHRSCRPDLRREFFQAASVLCELIGYMAFDTERHSLAQGYFIQALRFAKEAGNSAYGAYVLASLSNQAMYVNNTPQALRMARAAREGYKGSLVPAVPTEAAFLEATAHSIMGDKSSCMRSLREAENSFNRTESEPPYWATHWSSGIFASFMGGCWLNLGDARTARPYLESAWQELDNQTRRTVFSAGQLTRLNLLEGNLEEAASYAVQAAHAARNAKSQRSIKVIRELENALEVHKSHSCVRDFTELAAMALKN